MASTYELIASQTLGSAASSVTFSSIPGTYDDLVLTTSARTARAAIDQYLKIYLNGSSSSMSSRYLIGTGSSASSSTETLFVGAIATGDNATANTFGSSELYIPNYAGSTYKSASMTGAMETNATAANIYIFANLWSSTAAITSIEILPTTADNLLTGSSFYLYGVTHA